MNRFASLHHVRSRQRWKRGLKWRKNGLRWWRWTPGSKRHIESDSLMFFLHLRVTLFLPHMPREGTKAFILCNIFAYFLSSGGYWHWSVWASEQYITESDRYGIDLSKKVCLDAHRPRPLRMHKWYLWNLCGAWPTDRRTDGRTDTPSYRDARTHLKTQKLKRFVIGRLW